MTIEEAIAQIPEGVTAWSVSTWRKMTGFRCELSWLVNDAEDFATAYGSTPVEAIQAAIAEYRERLSQGKPVIKLINCRLDNSCTGLRITGDTDGWTDCELPGWNKP